MCRLSEDPTTGRRAAIVIGVARAGSGAVWFEPTIRPELMESANPSVISHKAVPHGDPRRGPRGTFSCACAALLFELVGGSSQST